MRSTGKRKASFESYGILTRNQKQKLEISLPTFQETKMPPKRRRKTVVETEFQEPTTYLDMLPRVPLQMIYKYLPIEDIVNTCLVSSRTRDVAADKGTWKGKVLVMKDEKMIDQYINIMRESPQLQGVYIDIRHFHNCKRIVEAVRYYLKNLRFLKVDHMSFDNLNLLLEKFRNLEKIEVVMGSWEFPDLLRALQHCSKLKELHIKEYYETHYVLNVAYIKTSWKEEVTEILANSFPSLTSLYVESVLRELKLENIVHILEEKKNQLVNLSFDLSEVADSEALDIISSCEGLNLDLTIRSTCLQFKLDKLKQLKSIKLTLFIYDKSNFTDLLVMLSGTPMSNVKVLKIHLFYCQKYKRKLFLEKLAMKFPKLQELVFVGDVCRNFNELFNLDNIIVLGSGLSYLSKCTSLKELTFSYIKLNRRCVENLQKCLTLEKITIDFTVSRQIRCVLEKMCFERNIILSVKNQHPFAQL